MRKYEDLTHDEIDALVIFHGRTLAEFSSKPVAYPWDTSETVVDRIDRCIESAENVKLLLEVARGRQ